MTETSDATQKHLPWAEGLPTRPDVDALLKAFPPETLAVGTQISDDAFRAVVGHCDGARFRTIYAAWQRRLARDYRVLLKRAKMTGFYVPSAAQTLAATHPTVEHAGRALGKQIRDLALVTPAAGAESDARDHHGRLLGVLRRETRKTRMNLLPPTAASAPPQIGPPAASRSARRSN